MGGWIPLVFLLGLGRWLKSPPPSQSPGPGQPRSPWVRGWCPVQCVPHSRRDSGQRQGTVRLLHHSPAHTLLGLPVFPPPCNPWVLYGTPELLMGAGYPENPGEAEHVPQGAPVPGPCWGPMVWGLKV